MESPDHWGIAEFAVETRRRGVALTPADALVVSRLAPRAVRTCLGVAETHVQLEEGLRTIVDVVSATPDIGIAIV